MSDTALQIDPELEAFDRFRVREIRVDCDRTASKFQSIAASLEPDERIKLKVAYAHNRSMESLKAVFSDPQAYKICSLFWRYYGTEDVNFVIPLINSCPELALLQVEFRNHSEFDFVSSVLEYPSNKVKVLDVPRYTKGDLPRFFAALGQSQVSALALFDNGSPEFVQGLRDYLAKDLLVRLKVSGHKQVPSELIVPLANCTRLTKLEMYWGEFSQSTAFTLPKSVTKLVLSGCKFVGGFDWSFLADNNVRELDLDYLGGVDGNQLGDTLAVHLRTKGLDKLFLRDCDFTNGTLAVVGVELGRTKRLGIDNYLNDASVELIALVLQSPNSELKELSLWHGGMANSIKTHLVPALKHPNCNLVKLSLLAYEEREEVAGRLEDTFRNRLALFVLLQGKQVRRRSPCPLRRLPVEMFRLVSKMLI
ncbi:hypothetical protein BASA81_011288 [Batrachochytrium salamandrivorans]|nr:hypothetical protein BASA81_011288 [Batrachochytrium salamandrivorans]